MYSKPWPRIITGAVVAMIAVAAFVTFTRGEAPTTDTASATLPGVSGKNAPVVVGSTVTPTPTSPASADAAEREAAEDAEDGKTPTKPTKPGGGPTTTPTTPAPDPDPTTEPPPPSPSPSPKPPCGLVGSILGSCK